MNEENPEKPLRRGWTTGACATAAARAAFALLHAGVAPNTVEIALPSGRRVAFSLCLSERGPDFARAGVIKDAGDDPDVTHGATIIATVREGSAGEGVTFAAGEGVGRVTRPGLPLAVGEPAINPVPRAMIRANIAEEAQHLGVGAEAAVEIAIPGGEELAKHTLNGRLGIVGGLSILGTTGIVVPYSCAAWVDSVHRAVDVARACGLTHIAGTTGSVSEAAVKALYGLPEEALVEMGDFAGALLKYLRKHPVARVTIGGGFAKMSKLAQGRLDLHSSRSPIDLQALATLSQEAGGGPELAARIAGANSALEALRLAQDAHLDLPGKVAARAFETAARALNNGETELEVLIFDREGGLLARSGFRKAAA
jgi:cobalt-precorrin-5B (C1)-methyltransferase